MQKSLLEYVLRGEVRNVNTHPVVRSNSKVDVLKYSLSGGQLNSILPFVVSIWSLSLIKSPTRVLLKFGTYQSRPIVPFILMNSLMISSSVLCRSTVGFMAGFCACGFDVPCPAAATGFAPCTCSGLLTNCLCAPSSIHCASVMALV